MTEGLHLLITRKIEKRTDVRKRKEDRGRTALTYMRVQWILKHCVAILSIRSIERAQAQLNKGPLLHIVGA